MLVGLNCQNFFDSKIIFTFLRQKSKNSASRKPSKMLLIFKKVGKFGNYQM